MIYLIGKFIADLMVCKLSLQVAIECIELKIPYSILLQLKELEELVCTYDFQSDRVHCKVLN